MGSNSYETSQSTIDCPRQSHPRLTIGCGEHSSCAALKMDDVPLTGPSPDDHDVNPPCLVRWEQRTNLFPGGGVRGSSCSRWRKPSVGDHISAWDGTSATHVRHRNRRASVHPPPPFPHCPLRSDGRRLMLVPMVSRARADGDGGGYAPAGYWIPRTCQAPGEEGAAQCDGRQR